MIRLLILADDFTGGLDTGVQFASRGVSTCVITDPQADFARQAEDCEVLVVVAETRHLSPKQAYDEVFSVVSRSMKEGIPHFYKKTDSALRGNIGAELAAVLAASGAQALPFIPALPAMNRVTRGGIHYIAGAPVAESVFGRDPFEPVRESDVVRLIALQDDVPAALTPLADLPVARGIAVIDAETDEDLLRAGQALAASDCLQVSAGCAGFASVLPELLRLSGKGKGSMPELDYGLFVLCGSVNPITQCQLDHGEAHGFTRVHIPAEEKLNPGWFSSADGLAELRGWQEMVKDIPWMILDANDAHPDNRETADRAKQMGLSMEDVRQRISASLGIILDSMLGAPVDRTLLITGGDTLLQGMNRLGVHRILPLTEVFPGVVLSRVKLAGQERYVITKSGGFGEENLLEALKNKIEDQRLRK